VGLEEMNNCKKTTHTGIMNRGFTAVKFSALAAGVNK
jgi:hypothetical protein